MGKIIRLADVEVQRLRTGGVFHVQQVRGGKIIDEWDSKNIVVNQGLNYLLSTGFQAQAAQTAWYVGIFSGNYTPLATDTGATIAGNSTESAAYTSTTRPIWTPPAAVTTTQELDNGSSKATFTMNASATIYGAFLCSSNVISGTSGVLFAASQFAASRSVVANDQLLVTYAISAASA